MWNGKRLVSEEWIAEASKYQVPSVPAGTRPDEVEAKGLTKDADGARGQYIIIAPDYDAVIAVTANSGNLQAEQDLIYKYLFPALKELK